MNENNKYRIRFYSQISQRIRKTVWKNLVRSNSCTDDDFVNPFREVHTD